MILEMVKNNLWYSTTGETLLEECDIETKDKGKTFFCKTHNRKLTCGQCEERI